MTLPPLQLLPPSTVAEASRAHEFSDKAKLYAGGAELLLLLRNRLMMRKF